VWPGYASMLRVEVREGGADNDFAPYTVFMLNDGELSVGGDEACGTGTVSQLKPIWLQ
jgi:hypothetical protein